MTISATERDELRQLARSAMGDRGAELLMAGLERSDLGAMEDRLTLQTERVRTELKGDMSALRTEFSQLRGEFGALKAQFGELRGDFGRLEGVVAKELAGIRVALASQNRVLYFALVATVVGIASLVFSAFQAGGG